MTGLADVTINASDLQRLIREPSPAMRSYVAGKVAGGYRHTVFTENENRIAMEIFRLLLKDTVVSVRKALANELKHCHHAPRDVILALANDEPEVAVEVLEHSVVLTDDDLTALVRATRETQKWIAVSRRKQLSGTVSGALIDTHHAKTIASLLDNQTADITREGFERIAEAFPQDQMILESLVGRGDLAPAFAERLYHEVSEALKKQLTQRYRLSWRVTNKAAEAVRNTTIIKFLSPWMSQEETSELVEQMHKHRRLTHSIVIHALCMGLLDFFEQSLAKMLALPLPNVKALLSDPGPLGFKALAEKAEFPENFIEALRTIYRLSVKETDDGQIRLPYFQARMIDRIIASGYHQAVENMPYFISLMRQQAHGQTVIH